MMEKRMIVRKTMNYDLFNLIYDNREIKMSGRSDLRESMRRQGFIPSLHAIVREGENGKYDVLDGQHRIAIAKKLGLPVYYVVEDLDINVAEINSTSVRWSLSDYLHRYLHHDPHGDYAEVQRYVEQFGLTIGQAAFLLAGKRSFGKVSHDFKSGYYQVKDNKTAWKAACLFCVIRNLSDNVISGSFLTACYAVTRIDWFDPHHFVKNAEHKFLELKSYRKVEDYLRMMETIYNYRLGKKKVPLAFEARNVLESM